MNANYDKWLERFHGAIECRRVFTLHELYAAFQCDSDAISVALENDRLAHEYDA